MYKYQRKGSYEINEEPDGMSCLTPVICFAPSIFCWWHINDTSNEIDKSSEPWADDTCWWVVDSMCNKCDNLYGMDQRYPISICTKCGHIQEE